MPVCLLSTQRVDILSYNYNDNDKWGNTLICQNASALSCRTSNHLLVLYLVVIRVLCLIMIVLWLCVMEWQWLKDWWRLKRWRNKKKKEQSDDEFCYCDECLPDVRIYLTPVLYPFKWFPIITELMFVFTLNSLWFVLYKRNNWPWHLLYTILIELWHH